MFPVSNAAYLFLSVESHTYGCLTLSGHEKVYRGFVRTRPRGLVPQSRTRAGEQWHVVARQWSGYMHSWHGGWWPLKTAAYFKKRQSPASKGRFENPGAASGLFAATASRQQAGDVYNLGSPLPPPPGAFHPQPRRWWNYQARSLPAPLLHPLPSPSPVAGASPANHPLCHHARLRELMSCSARTVLQGEEKIWFLVLPVRETASGRRCLLCPWRWAPMSLPCCCLRAAQGSGGSNLPEERRTQNRDPVTPVSHTTKFFFKGYAHVFQKDNQTERNVILSSLKKKKMQTTSVWEMEGGQFKSKSNNHRKSHSKGNWVPASGNKLCFNFSFTLWKARRYLTKKGKACMAELGKERLRTGSLGPGYCSSCQETSSTWFW